MKIIPNEYGGDERTTIARRYTENAEAWLRKLVHLELYERFGQNYITEGNWKKELKSYVKNKYQENPGQYSREIDATTFDQIIDIVCNQNHWDKWKDGLNNAYPDGSNEARTFLQRIKAIRNNVSHGQVCSGRQLEQAVCYTNDLTDSIKEYFRRKGLNRDFNVPAFVKVLDNAGNTSHLLPGHHYRVSDFSSSENQALYPGITLVVEVEVDPSFEANDYDVVWWVKTSTDKGNGTKAVILIENRHVAERMELQFKLTTKLDWHRGNVYDDALDVYYKILPP